MSEGCSGRNVLNACFKWPKTGMCLLASLLIVSNSTVPSVFAKEDPCQESDFAKTCAKRCAPLCNDALYFVDHEDFCLSEPVFSGKPGDADVGCADGSAKASVGELDQCLVEAKRNARSIEEKLEALRSQPQLMEELRERLKGVPTCAPDSPTLMRMFKCLEDEGERVDVQFSKLEARGYPKLKDVAELCKISRDEMTADFSSAQDLHERAIHLQEVFGRINACKTEYEEWGTAASAASEKRASGALFQTWIDKVKKDLEPTAVMARTLDDTIAKITEQTTSIIDSVGQGIVICE
jgi:hypothetical protein